MAYVSTTFGNTKTHRIERIVVCEPEWLKTHGDEYDLAYWFDEFPKEIEKRMFMGRTQPMYGIPVMYSFDESNIIGMVISSHINKNKQIEVIMLIDPYTWAILKEAGGAEGSMSYVLDRNNTKPEKMIACKRLI